MRKYRLIQGFVFETLLTMVAVGCGSSANDGGGAVGGVSATSGGESAAGGSGAGFGGGGSAVGGNGSAATTTPASGGSSAGAATTLGGNASTGGSAPAAATGVLGQQCSPPGTLGCNGINQKLTLVCGANGTWQTNQTCNSATQVCDPRPGSTQGTCQEQDALCTTVGAGQQFCNAYAEWSCDAWGMKASKRRDCPIGACVDGKCLDPSSCLTEWNFLSCSSDCPSVLDTSTRCSSGKVWVGGPPTDGVNGSAIVHVTYESSVGVYDPECPTRHYLAIVTTQDPTVSLRIQVQKPWHVSESLDQTRCDHGYPGVSCDVLSPATGVTSIWTDDPNAPPANVSIIASPTKPNCPPI